MKHLYKNLAPPGLALLVLLLIVLSGVFRTSGISAETSRSQQTQRTDNGGAMEPRPIYSKSGYDLTPLSAERIAAIVETLTPEQRQITQAAGTEPAFCGNLTNTEEPGIYVSIVGGLPLFRSTGKFISKSGWASFFEPFDPAHIIERPDQSYGMDRVEILDARSGAHLGHLFEDGPAPTGRRYCVNSAAMRFIPDGEPIPSESQPVKTETAYFAGGCFWGIEHKFAQINGVIDAISGYQGGRVKNPGYKQVCSGETGHAETVKVLFDTGRVSYRDLLKAFFEIHEPTTLDRQGFDFGSQYRSAIFTTSDQQAEIARAYITELDGSGAWPDPIVTTVEPAPDFYPAEEYHQDYHHKHQTRCSR